MAIEYCGKYQPVTPESLENEVGKMLNPIGLIDWTHNPLIDPCNIDGSIEACSHLMNKRLPFYAITYTITMPKRQNFNLSNEMVSEISGNILCAVDHCFPTVVAARIDSYSHYIITVLFGIVSLQGNRIWGMEPQDGARTEGIIKDVLETYFNRMK